MRLAISVLALAACASSAAAQEIPTRRAGLWEVTINHDGKNTPPQTMQQCTDAETDKLMNAFGGALSADMCTKQDIRKVGATLVISATCQVGPMKSTSESVVSGDFSSNYTVKVTSKIEGLPASAKDVAGGTTTIQARWVGACKPDQRPGDIVMANGQTMNIRDLRKMMDGAKGGAPKGAPK
jgi:Protein of unknown function (DUF3617)